MDGSADILAKLTYDSAGDWQLIGGALHDLYKMSEVRSDGRTWHEVVLDVLAEVGRPVSSGHLHRIRRSYEFLHNGMEKLGIPEERGRIAKISSIDLAERLYQIDEESGLKALDACLDIKRPATKAKIQSLYDNYLRRHPDRMGPMQVAWERRRSISGHDDNPVDLKDRMPAGIPDISKALTSISEYVSRLETDLQVQAQRIADLEQELRDVNDELRTAKQHLQIVGEELNDAQNRERAGY